jgi:hypothetical protein
MINNKDSYKVTKERKDLKLSIRLNHSDLLVLKDISSKNVSYAIRHVIRFYNSTN